jgi:hypothetical protein
MATNGKAKTAGKVTKPAAEEEHGYEFLGP